MASSLEVLAKEIRRKAEEEAKKILEDAYRKAEEIKRQAREKLKEEARNRARQQALILRRKIIGESEEKIRKEIVLLKDKIVREILEETKNRLEEIASGKDQKYDYNEILYKLIREAVEKIDSDKVIIHANERDSKWILNNKETISLRLSKDLGRKIELIVSNNQLNTIGGIVAQNPDGTKIFYNTFESRLLGKEDKIRIIIGKILRGEEK